MESKYGKTQVEHNAYLREWSKLNPEKIQAMSQRRYSKYYCTLKGRATHLLNNARNRAKRNRLEFELDAEWLKPKLENNKCEVTNLPFSIVINGGRGHKENSFSPSLERKDNSLGYTKENTQVVCWIYNRAKGAFPIADLLTMLRALDAK